MNSIEKEIINTLQKNVELCEEQTKKYEEDADRLFLFCLLKPLKQLPEPIGLKSIYSYIMKYLNG